MDKLICYSLFFLDPKNDEHKYEWIVFWTSGSSGLFLPACISKADDLGYRPVGNAVNHLAIRELHGNGRIPLL